MCSVLEGTVIQQCLRLTLFLSLRQPVSLLQKRTREDCTLTTQAQAKKKGWRHAQWAISELSFASVSKRVCHAKPFIRMSSVFRFTFMIFMLTIYKQQFLRSVSLRTCQLILNQCKKVELIAKKSNWVQKSEIKVIPCFALRILTAHNLWRH